MLLEYVMRRAFAIERMQPVDHATTRKLDLGLVELHTIQLVLHEALFPNKASRPVATRTRIDGVTLRPGGGGRFSEI